MTAITTIVPDEALLLEVARSAAARHLKLLTNGRRSVLSPVDIPGFKPIIVKEKAMQATIRIEIEDEAIDCCGFDPDAPPPPPSTAELEAAGQMRLLP